MTQPRSTGHFSLWGKFWPLENIHWEESRQINPLSLLFPQRIVSPCHSTGEHPSRQICLLSNPLCLFMTCHGAIDSVISDGFTSFLTRNSQRHISAEFRSKFYCHYFLSWCKNFFHVDFEQEISKTYDTNIDELVENSCLEHKFLEDFCRSGSLEKSEMITLERKHSSCSVLRRNRLTFKTQASSSFSRSLPTSYLSPMLVNGTC